MQADLNGNGEELFAFENASTSTTGQTQILVRTLIDNFQHASREIPNRELITMLKGRDLAGRDLRSYATWLAEAHSYFRDDSDRDLTLTFASEWILDNYYIIRQAIRQIIEDMPSGFYKKLPKLTRGPSNGLPRIYAIAQYILSHQVYLLNPIDLGTILIQLQQGIQLTMGELWALPIFLRYSCIQTLAHKLERVIKPKETPHLPVYPLQVPGSAEFHHDADSAADNRIVANIILSLRTIGEQNWNEFFEKVSQHEQILRQDPSGTYPLMDFTTRDLYRKEIEKLSLVECQSCFEG